MTRPTLLCALAALLLVACGSEPETVPQDPAVAPPPSEVNWGEAKDGLQLGLEFDRHTFKVGEEITAVVRARNVGEGPLKLHDFNHDWFHQITLTQVTGKTSWLGGAGLFIERDGPNNVTLAPGEAWERTAGLNDGRRRFLRIIPNRRPGDDWDYRDSLPPGRYRGKIGYGPGTTESGFYRGIPWSNEVEILIVD